MDEKPRRMTRKEQTPARSSSHNIIMELHQKLKPDYRFDCRLVGSASLGTMVCDLNGEYDVDYQLLLSKKSKCFNKNKFVDPTKIKNDFYDNIQSICENNNKDKIETIENSTTAITLIHKEKGIVIYHIDFVIIDSVSEPELIIRSNNKKEDISKNEYNWNDIRDRKEAYTYFKELSYGEKTKLIDDKIIPAKIEEKKKKDNDPTKVSSSEIFIKEVMNHKNTR
jgi:hypothetical protein